MNQIYYVYYFFQTPKKCSTIDIERELKIFGLIESVEVINKTEKNVEAYVLFDDSQAALQAFLAYRNGVKSSPNLLYIVPANTWHQPNSISLVNEIDPARCFMLELNDDCLLELFKYLDLDALVKMAFVCKRFQNLLKRYTFPKVKAYTTFIYHGTLRVIRQTMKCIGPHLDHLFLRYQNHGNNPENHLECEHEERTTYKVLQNISSNLTKLTIRMTQGQKPSENLLQIFLPVFSQITFLEWDVDSDCETIQNLRNFCSNLESLVIIKRKYTCTHEHEVAELHWPSLKYLKIFQCTAELNSVCQQFFILFIEKNPQIKCLKLTNVSDNLFQAITQFSQSIEYLELLQNSDFCGVQSKSILDLLCNLMNLRVFVIRTKTTEHLRDVEKRIKCLGQMQHLNLIVMVTNYKPLVCQDIRFPYAHQWSELTVEGNSLKIRIGDNSTNIEFSADKTTLVNIINTIVSDAKSYRKLKRDIQYSFEASNDLFPEVKQSIVYENIDCSQFIHVNSTL